MFIQQGETNRKTKSQHASLSQTADPSSRDGRKKDIIIILVTQRAMRPGALFFLFSFSSVRWQKACCGSVLTCSLRLLRGGSPVSAVEHSREHPARGHFVVILQKFPDVVSLVLLPPHPLVAHDTAGALTIRVDPG